jgi:hypothetical protein
LLNEFAKRRRKLETDAIAVMKITHLRTPATMNKVIALLVCIGYKTYRLIGNCSDRDVYSMFRELL